MRKRTRGRRVRLPELRRSRAVCGPVCACRTAQDQPRPHLVHPLVHHHPRHLRPCRHVVGEYGHQHHREPLRRQEDHALLPARLSRELADAGYRRARLAPQDLFEDRQRARPPRHRLFLRRGHLLGMGDPRRAHRRGPVHLSAQAVQGDEPPFRRLQHERLRKKSRQTPAFFVPAWSPAASAAGRGKGRERGSLITGRGSIRARSVGRNALSISRAYNSYNERETAIARLRG